MKRVLPVRAPAVIACAVLFLAFHPCRAHAQTLTITGGVQTYPTLTNTTVTMTGKSELRITGTSAPMSGCVINLNSSDAWFFMTNIRPSVVSSTYLSQIKVNGANAVASSNVRIVQYAMGTVVIPHASAYQPLQAFSGPAFTGTSKLFSQYTYYNSATSLGAMNRAISSFKLKRGYMATVSTQTNGTGPSKNYVAQDGDLEVAILPAELDNAIRFVRVFPWRWVSKKGTCDTAAATFDAAWFYNWNNADNTVQSTLNYEFVPIRQQPYWPGLPTNKPDSTHISGFNEPDNPVEDAYKNLNSGSVDSAIGFWPDLLGCGLRVGSPAPTDGGKAWLYDFMTKADDADLRVDYIAIHNYQCGLSANTLYTWLKDVYDRTGRPIWLTEFNNGANWTTCADPTFDQNATAITSFIDMLDNAPFVERYSIYSAVEEVRQLIYNAGGLTPTGTVYRDNASPTGYVQAFPATGGRGVAQLPFEGTVRDTSGFGNNGLAANTPSYTAGPVGQALLLDGSNNYVQLPAGVGSSAAFSFAGWVNWDGGAIWQRIFDFGRDILGANSTRYVFLTPSNGTGIRFVIRNGGTEQGVTTTAPLATGEWQHVAVTLSAGTARIYLSGTQVASGAVTITPSQVAPKYNYLGKSAFPADPFFKGGLDDVRIADYAFTAAQVAALATGTNTPPQFTNATISGAGATQGQPYSGSISGTATDPGDTIAYSRGSGPAWLQVAADGTLSGTPTFADEGLHEFTVIATDSVGATAFAVLTIQLPSVSGNGTWSQDISGTWSETTNWTNNFPANGAGYTANFNTLNIAADRTVTLNGSRMIGTLRFDDTSGGQTWTLNSTGGGTLTMDTGVTTTSPSIVVSHNTATILAPLAGTNGFTKSGPGTLILGGNNSISGDIYIDTGSTSASEGAVRAANPNALTNASNIAIRNNNVGSSTLELDGTLGNITTSAATALSGRTVNVAGIRNLSGSNTLSGTLTINSGGSFYVFQSDAGTLGLGSITSAATAVRTLTFQGNGNANISGMVLNGTGTTALIKSGTGTLTLGALSTFTGNLTINGGIVAAASNAGAGTGGSNLGALAPSVSRSITINSGGTLSLTNGNVLGTGGSTNTLANVPLTINSGGVLQTGLNGSGSGWWNKLGPVTLSGGTIHVGSGVNTGVYQGLALTGTVTVTGNVVSTIDNFAASNSTSNGVHLGQNATAGQVITFNVADVTGNSASDLNISAKLVNTSANATASGLNKTGVGTLTLSGTNTYTGATTVTAGTLLVNGSNAASALTVATTGTLGGNGIIGGAVTVQSGGTLSPGTGIGNLTVNNSLNLQAGSTTQMELLKSSGTNDVLNVAGMLTYGGALVVTNLGGTLADGDSFTLFKAGSITGSFSSSSFPALNSGLSWFTGDLASGVLKVLGPSTFQGWAAAYSFAAGEGAPNADGDHDGIVNALEWLTGTNPLDGSSGALPTMKQMSASELGLPGDKTYLTLQARVRKQRSGVTLTPGAAATLEDLSLPGAATNVAQAGTPVDEGEFEIITYYYTTPIEDSPTGRGYIRLQALVQ